MGNIYIYIDTKYIDTKYCIGNCFHVRATSSLAQTSVMVWALDSWVLIVPSDFADLGQKRWEKIYIDATVAACWNRGQNYCHVCLLTALFLPCPFSKGNYEWKTGIGCSQSTSPKKPICGRRRFFIGVIRNWSVIFSVLLGFFPSSICVHVSVTRLGRVTENTAGDGCREGDRV